MYVFLLCFVFLKERRKLYEANLEKVGLELEIEDKMVRTSSYCFDYVKRKKELNGPQKHMYLCVRIFSHICLIYVIKFNNDKTMLNKQTSVFLMQ